MHLLDAETKELKTFNSPHEVEFAVLVLYETRQKEFKLSPDGEQGLQDDKSKDRILEKACQLAISSGVFFLWSWSWCVDETSGEQVSETINSLPIYYKSAKFCLAYLSDLPCDEPGTSQESWRRSRFWSRTWALQELLLSSCLHFYDARWHFRGERSENHLAALISSITGIDQDVLRNNQYLQELSVARKMSWAINRHCPQPEDGAYSLLGLFDISLPIKYGEGATRAFWRLQEQILKKHNDVSILAWSSKGTERYRGVLADCPEEFEQFGKSDASRWPIPFNGDFLVTKDGLLLCDRFSRCGQGLFFDLGFSGQAHDIRGAGNIRYGIVLKFISPNTYVRLDPGGFHTLSHNIDTAAMEVLLAKTLGHDLLMEDEGDWVVVNHPPFNDYEPDITREYFSETSRNDTLHAGSWVEHTTRCSPICDTASLTYETGPNHLASTSEGSEGQIVSNLVRNIVDEFSLWEKDVSRALKHRRKTELISPRGGRSQKTRRQQKTHHSISRPEFACPFYVRDPERHIECLRRHGLDTIDDVKSHIWLHHRLPPYCPTCKRSFSSAAWRDKHIVQRTCVFSNQFPHEGVSEDQRKLVLATHKGISAKSHWRRIWHDLFPGKHQPHSIHLRSGLGYKVSHFRRFWKQQGRKFIASQSNPICSSTTDPFSSTMSNLSATVFDGAISLIEKDFRCRDVSKQDYFANPIV